MQYIKFPDQSATVRPPIIHHPIPILPIRPIIIYPILPPKQPVIYPIMAPNPFKTQF
jgi:hypothetical protein